MSYRSSIILLKDTESIQSYGPLISKAAELSTIDSSLDILIVSPVTKLNHLDVLLAEIYTLATDTLQLTEKPQIKTRVLFNKHYKDIKEPDWDLLILDTSDNSLDEFEYEDRDLIHTVNVQRSESEPIKLKQEKDDSSESIESVVALGGTFDHFHDGHKILLTAGAFLAKDKLIVGITDDELLEKKKYKEFLQSYDYRKHVVLEFLNHIRPDLEIDPNAIRDICGPTGYIEEIDSLVVSRETIAGGDYINKFRAEKGFRQLKVHVINVIGGEEDDGFQNKLSSTQLRKEEYEATHKTSAGL
ncbi:D-beta-D-heptose 7-phosphate kinase [Wickerhamomyces ciferrii]|uniref:D-beta-D-heptose 7-phosphate kinase n=1 Tax=Wickerhamomyces ciferrii (strain ATCC 14091 / BCRC 22168 / CBS 111 / JCM 3599 / NBRC 0793 / NRRL Y-1031 F-60-10) TaxID=1206466 RepID=K0KSS5_WICCF|nr:D-beta-D-heptose 7-phosphate kinase [Wickerhamomyces ciferrii]CCH46211.1 D-beta-D-heptose 7-phosphate kinase [Wickerhamomyces ciferrii]